LDVFFGISPYTFLAYFVSPQKYLAVLFFFCSLLLMGFIHRCTGGRSKIDSKFFNLETKPYLLNFLSNLEMSMSNLLKQESQYQWLVGTFCCFLGFRNFSFNYSNSPSKKTIVNIKKQYQLH
jgi:hypothetical protein